MRKYFGTDGVRGIANIELTSELAFKLGRAGAYVLQRHSKNKDGRTTVFIGSDTRISKDMLSSAIAAGVMSVGGDVVDIGIAPTPAIAYLTKKHKADAGIVISASHNPMEYNGIKFFNSLGLKLDDSIELEIEEYLSNMDKIDVVISHEHLGTRVFNESFVLEYEDFLVNAIKTDLKGFKVSLDCANGAAYKVAPNVFSRLGAEVVTISNSPDGTNINKNCGSTHPENLCKSVIKNNSDIGLAFDGDEDRLIAVDENGNVIDGDKIMLICAKYLKEQGKLKSNKLVVTVMSNLGLHIASKHHGIELEITSVGDRYVLENLLANGYSLGGEQSGHMIFLDHNTTGDGVLSGLILSDIIKSSGKSISELATIMDVYPQILINAKVKNENKNGYMTDPVIKDEICKLERIMDGQGRVLIRPSGTEPLVRVMIEGEDKDNITAMARDLACTIESRLG
ncbi:MAG: phosphoglucosamine mutase [Proteocatella sp.]